MIDLAAGPDVVVHGDNADLLAACPDESFQLIYVDPPFNTGRRARRRTLAHASGDGGRRPHGLRGPALPTERRRLDVLRRPLRRLPGLPRAAARGGPPAARAIAAPSTCTSTTREAHYVQGAARRDLRPRLLPERDHLGLRLRRPRQAPLARQARHDPGLRQGPGRAPVRQDAVDRIPYLAPGLVGPEKAARGKLPTDVWWHTIVPADRQGEDRLPDAEARGRPAPDRCEPSSRPGDWVLDFFAGSGTTGAVAAATGTTVRARRREPAGLDVMRARLPAGTAYVDLAGRPLDGG